MDKVKIKNLVVNNKKKLVITLAILLISILLITIITYATSNQDYVVEIKDDGSENIAQNAESSVTKKIVSETTKSLTYEVAISNLKTRSTNPEVAVLIDTSSSMSINDIETQVKPKAIEFVKGLLADVKGVKVSISNNHAVKAGLGTVTTSNYTSHINGLVAGQGSNLADGIDKAISTFSATENEKYLIIFSDATDPVLEKLQLAVNNGINVYSILTDMTNNEYTQNQDTVGTVQMISDIESFSPIYNKINNSIINVKVKDIFTLETKEYFTLTKATNNPADVIFTETEDGYELDCANIKAGETKKVQFTLTLDENSKIDSRKIYTDLNTSSKMTINYDNYTGDKRNYEMEHSPIYVICKKYSLTIKAVSEKSDKLPVKDLEIKVVGTVVKGQKEDGTDIVEKVCDKVLKTNDKGEILIDELKTLGTITFEIKPNVNQLGYSETSATTIIVHNDPSGNGITAEADVGEEPVVNNTTRNIDVKLPIKTQIYYINLETIDSTNSNIKLGNIEYRLIQPKLNSKYEMEALYKSTDENGKLTFTPSVMTKDGTYEYVLSQLNSQDGYDSIGNVTLYVTFRDGKIVDEQILGKQYGFTHKYNENVETTRISETEGKVVVKNQSENADTFRLEINVADSNNNEKKIQGAIYNVEVTRIASSGQQITNTVNGCITDENGQIKLDLPGTGNVQVKITEVNPTTGYHQDTQTKKIVFSRTDGRVQLVTARDPIDLKAEPDSDANALVVNLTSVERSGKNRIQIHMIDNIERDINIPGVNLTLINLVNNKTYTAVSDANGIANFLVDDEEPGDYVYDIMLTNNVPYGYTSSERKLGGISVHFDDNKFIDSCSDTSDTGETIFLPSYELMDEDFSYHTGKVEIGLTPDAANTYNFQVKLVDDKNKAIKDAKYDIAIEDGNGNILRKITGRATDSNGMITTRLVGTDNIVIRVKQTETIKGHIINTQEQIIQLTKVNGSYQITHQEPYIYDGSTQKIGAQISGKNVIYHDVNKEKTGNNTILNLYVNKKDINNNYVGGVKTVLTSETLKLEGKAITPETNYTGTAKSGKTFTLNPAITDAKDNVGYFEVEGIQVNGAELDNGERVDYLYMYEVDVNGDIIENTKVTLKLTFRYNENKGIVQITNVEATWGNRLLSKREFSGYETNVAYESNVYLDIYTNYDDVGNFALDLAKVDKENKELQGAKYDVTVTRLDGTRVVRKGIDITDSTEFAGIIVAAGTKIEITEVEAPIGYALNEYTEILTIKSIDVATGKMKVELEKSAYATPRAKLEPLQETLLEDGTYKTEAKVILTDYELDTFKFGIIAQDVTTQNPIEGYEFKISTSQGAQSNTEPTNREGKTVAIVGANYEIENFKVTYTVDTLKVADYYKKLSKPIPVEVVFDLNGQVKTAETIAANEANKAKTGYGTLWTIENTDNTEGGNDIDIKINIEPQDKLTVNISTIDRRTKKAVTGNEYKITPSINIPGTGTTKVEVGYVAPGKLKLYTIEQTADNMQYDHLENQTFKIEYDENGNIKTVLDLSENIVRETHSGKTLNLTIEVDPTVTVNITSKDAITGAVINTIEYTISPVSERLANTGTTRIEFGYAKQSQKVEYTLSQANDVDNYVKLNDLKFELEYDQDDKIILANSLSTDVLTVISNTINSVNIEIKVEPGVPFVIDNIGFFDNSKLSGGEFEISTETPIVKTARTDSTGIGKTYVDKLQENTTVVYKVKQTAAAKTYCTVDEFEIEVTFNENKEIVDAKIKGGSKVNEHVTFVTVTHKQPSVSTDIGYNGNDKGIVNIEVKNYPAVQFEITNIDRQNNTKILNGTSYKVTSTTNEEDTASTNPTAKAYLGKGAFSNKITYTISEVAPSARYQTQVIDTVIEVEFDPQGKIIKADITQGNDITTVSLPGLTNPLDCLKVDVTIKSNPQLAITINKVDEETGAVLNGVDFEVIARIEKQNIQNYTEEEIEKITLNTSTLTEESYLEEVFDRIKVTKEQVENIKEEIGLNKIINTLKENNNLTTEEENEVNNGINYSQKVAKLVGLNKATKTQINNIVKEVTNKEVIDKLIADGTTTQDTVNDRLNEIKNLVRLDVDRVTTDQNGNATAYMDKTLENKTIEYVLKETKKKPGYDWQDEEIRIAVTYDSTGKMIADNPVQVVSGNVEITRFDIDTFQIDTKIKNTPSKETRIHLTVEDTYDSDKKLETAKFDAYLVDPNSVNSLGNLTFAPDNNYNVKLESGTTAHGEDIESLGVYKGGAGTRILRLVQTQTPNTSYVGTTEHKKSYQSIAYALLVRVSFDDEGHVTGASLYEPGGDSRTIGYIADSRYLTVSYSRNTIEITVKYYPMLNVQMVTKDIYTGEALQGTYTVTTDIYGSADSNQIKSGYINPYDVNDSDFGRHYGTNYTTDSSLNTTTGNVTTLYDSAKVGLAPAEADNVPSINVDSKTRNFYVYEQKEPTSPIQYQKYRNWYLTRSEGRLLAIVNVTYNEKGELTDAKLVSERSTNNITSGFIEINKNAEENSLQITVKYAPITTITATVVDQVTGKGLDGIRIDPYLNNTHVTNNSYEYRTEKYYTTGSNGKAGWTYWGASVSGGLNRYELNTYTVGSGYNGYFDPGNIILDVAYDENGRVTGVTPRSTDSYGDINAVDISWTNNDIKITIPYSRKFNVKLNKVDYYDSNTKLGAVFKVVTSENAETSIAANSVSTLGKVYPGKTVRYTLSETTAPHGYVPVSNLDFYVTFNNDGTVRSTHSESDYYKFVKSAPVDKDVNRVGKVDLEANIKNKPRFNVSLDLTDKFYPTLKLEGATFKMTNNKGDTAQGEVKTDKNGYLETYIGPIYPAEEVEYTIQQTSTVNGYYANNSIIKFKVKFNESGKIESYSLISGQDVVTMDPNKFVNTKGVHLSITNMPKDVKIGVHKYDELTGEAMETIKFNVKTEVSGKVTKNTAITTNDKGNVVGVVDTFATSKSYKVVKYTISEIEVPNTYRKIQDVVIQVTYNQDGSMLAYETLSNDSNVGIQVATKKQIKFLDGVPVHINLTVPNDNAYDLIIKNEDKNYNGLGIEGTKYDVTINGMEIDAPTTNANGITTVPNRTEKGEITIKITERNIGEGYREEPNNETTIVLQKGEQVYSLALDPVNGNSNPTYANVVVDEAHGTVTVTFKNETKLELNLVKDDINTGATLEGAIFAITSEEIDNRGNTVANTLKTITNTKLVTVTNDDGTTSQAYQIDESEKTNNNGLFYKDLGLAYQNKTIKYTLTEVKAPEGYTEIVPITVTVKFDAYGRISEIIDNSFRAECYLDSNTGKSHNMIFNISNGTVDPQYTVKVVSEDSQTGMRINGSIFQVAVLNSAGETYKDVTGTTRDVTKTVNNRTFVSEKGVMKVTGIKAEGDIKISLNQVETATGYVYGKNTVAGNVIANAEFTVSASELEKDLTLTKKDDGGFEVTVDNTNREIIIKVKNDPELTFDITKIDGKTKQKLNGAEFIVTSVMQTSATTTPTTLNETSKLTDENGHTTLNGGIIMAGRTMIYTLKENKMDKYEQLDDIVLLVQYDTKGNIMYYEILSDVNDIEIMKNENAFINETKRILGETDVPGIVEVDFETYKVPTGIGTKILQLQISNKQEAANKDGKYQIFLEKHHIDDEAYPYLIPGVTFEMTVEQEYGKAKTTWVDTTNEDGIIMSPTFEGYGNITITIKEISTVDGFKLNSKEQIFRGTKNKDTHKIEGFSQDVNYEFSEDNTRIILKPVNEVASNTYGMVINKVDKNSNVLIANNPAEFEITRIEKYQNLTPVENEETGEITYEGEVQEIKQPILKQSTDETGRIVVNNLIAPEEGTYRYVIKETKAPEGYVQATEDMELDITFAKNEADELIMTNVEVVKGEDKIKIAKAKEQLLNLIILNTNEKDVAQDGEYKFNIIKVDNEKNPITTSAAVFKLTNMQTNEVNYYETNEEGKLEIPAFKMPEEEGKYIYKLNEVKAPNGYVLNVNDIMLELEFAKDEEGKMYLKDVQVQGDNIAYEAPEEGELPDTTITVKVTNEEGGNGTGNTNDKRYTFVLNKVDSKTKEIITENVEFEIMLANGEIVKGKTNDNGQLRIEDVFMPAQPGEYELVIKEKTTPSGYKVDEEPKNVKVTFTGYGENMVISDIKLGDTNNKNIEILQDKCTDQYVEVNILNEKENKEKLYVVSKKYNKDYKFYDEFLEGYNNKKTIYDEGEDVYEILDYFYGVYADKGNKKGKPLTPAYTIDKPFIDTKIAKGDNKTVLAEEFIGNLESNGHMEVLGYDGNPIGPKDIVATGMVLRSTLDDQELTFDIVVKGDGYKAPNEKKPGRVNTGDKNALIKYIAGDTTYVTDPLQLRALDIDMDGRLNTSDKREITEIIAYDAERTPSPYYETWSNSNILSDKKHIQYVTKEEYENQQN